MADPEKNDTDYKRILEIFKKYDVRYFFYNGGNDSMDTCDKISRFMEKSGYECRVMGVPKTIDNDLYNTDHCPGFGSAAKYIATSCAEVYKDAHVYDTGMIVIIEIMGRHAGWLAASAASPGSPDAAPTSSTCLRRISTWTSSSPTPPGSTRKGQLHRGRVRGHSLRRWQLCLRGEDQRDRRLRSRPAGRPGLPALLRNQGEDQALGARHRAFTAAALRAHIASATDVSEAFMPAKSPSSPPSAARPARWSRSPRVC